ncbi:CSLREA domain-containing protein [Acinetobacter sp. 3657]|uniref:CSLREA domain-containing protein n=1 Tax=Acinetobacter sp. 3657 TaxID=2817764 RepID=UPI0028610ACF|nr:CSLREA domain-containing protein [Prolinoborus sp. 3657]
MKNYKKALLVSVVITSMSLIAATNNDAIIVTTFVDEDDENPNACSLREAIRTAELRKSYGGCSIGNIDINKEKKIQLDEGVYILDRELVPKVDLTIMGKLPVDWEKKNVLTNAYPARTDLKTTIRARNNTRLFNTTVSNTKLALNNLVLSDGQTTDRGGAIYAGSDVKLENTKILNSKAAVSGGAVFLAGPSASLEVNNSLIQFNNSPKGSVVAMTCFNDNLYPKRDIKINSSSIIGNGNLQSLSMFEFCGEPGVSLNTNTITGNQASLNNGNLIKFTGDTLSGSASQNNPSILSDGSIFLLKSNTIVSNAAKTIFLYDKLGYKELGFNLIAFNDGGYACRYLLGEAKVEENTGLVLDYNALSLSGTKKCDLPEKLLGEKNTNISVDHIGNIGTLLSPLQKASEENNFLPLFYPKNNLLINVKHEDDIKCSLQDQRGLSRLVDGTLYFNPDARNSCDIGSVELKTLTAGDIIDLSNTSLSLLIEGYKLQVTRYENLIKNPDDPNLVTSDKEFLEIYKNLLKTTQDAMQYRTIFVDLRRYSLPIPEDIQQMDGSHRLQFFDDKNYQVEVETLGKGIIEEQVYNVKADPNLVCEWNKELQQFLIYRKDDEITQAGDKVFCKYTIKSNITGTTSSGLIKAAFVNTPPIAKDTTVTLKYLENQKVTLDLLDFASDEGDTGESRKGPINNPNKPQFWRNADGIELPIRLSNVSSNLIITADREGKCPAPDQQEKCVGGNIYIKEANSFNPFNFAFNYQVYDADASISNLATVKVISTATTTDDSRKASHGGGGSTGILSLFGLLGLLAYRRLRK